MSGFGTRALPSILGCCVLLAAAASSHAMELRCEIDEKHYCEQGAGCKEVPATIWNFVNLDNATYRRCDTSGCDEYRAKVSAAGVYYVIDLPGHGTLAKMSLDGSVFVEVATLVGTVYTSFGSCR